MSQDKPRQSEESYIPPSTTPDNPTAGESYTPPPSKERAPSTDDPKATDMASANTPDPETANPQVNANAAAEPKAKKPAAKEGGAKPAGKAAKKEKPPAVEDKPFAEFIEEHYIPALKDAFANQGINDLQVSLENQKVPIGGLTSEECPQVIGRWMGGERQFSVYFPDEDIKGSRAFSCAERANQPSTLEPFLIDERKIDLDLLVFYVVQRLNAQKWLNRN